MKILHYLNHAKQANGHVAVAVDLASAQAQAGHDVAFASGKCDFLVTLKNSGVTYYPVREHDGPLRFFKMAVDLYPVIRTFRPDVVNAHMVAAAISAKLIRYLRLFKLVTTIHNSFDKQARLMGVGDRAIAVSEAVRQKMISRGISEKKLKVVRNGTIGGARRPLMPLSAHALARPAIVTIAGLHDRKGIRDLLIAFDHVYAECPDAHLYIIGDGPGRQEYEKLAREQICHRNISFMGLQKDPREFLVEADIFVLASLSDPFPLVISEARQMGCAIVATDVDGIPEALWHGEKGILVPPQNPRLLAKALVDLLTDDTKRLAFRAAAMSDLDDILVIRMSSDTLKVYEEVLKT